MEMAPFACAAPEPPAELFVIFVDEIVKAPADSIAAELSAASFSSNEDPEIVIAPQ